MRYSMIIAAALLLGGITAQAEEIVCSGSITSIQGEGLVARTHRFEVYDIAGEDVMAVLEKCKKIAQEKQNRAARKNPGGNFRSFSQVDLECGKGAERFLVRRTIQTGS